MDNTKTLGKLEQKLGYTFKNKDILTEALTHSSYANELIARNIPSRSNERLEFLGDAVLEIIASTYLYEFYYDLPEGELSKRRSEIICTSALSGFARKIGLGNYLFFGNGEKVDGKNKDRTLENAFEALLGAIYLDSGKDIDTVRAFVLPFLSERAKEAATDLTDYKSELQQIIQQSGVDTLCYVMTGSSGPDHEKIFEVEAHLNSNIIGRGTGKTKREAEQNAAKEALALFGEI